MSRLVEIGDENWIDLDSLQYVAVSMQRVPIDKEHPDIYMDRWLVGFIVAGFGSNVSFDNRIDVDRTLAKLNLPPSTWKEDHEDQGEAAHDLDHP